MWYDDRWYQRKAKDAIIRDIVDHNPLIAVPTGAGKTIIMGRFIYDFLAAYPFANILVLSNTKEILKQDYDTICKFFPGVKIGLYSAGLDSKTIEKITVAGIQSIYKKAELFQRFDIVIVDEAHTLDYNEKTMYGQFVSKVKAKYVGMSATPFRIKSGFLHKGENRLFTKLSYDLTKLGSFNRLIEEGHLCKLISKAPDFELDVKGVKTTAGDYNQKELSKVCDRIEITNQAVDELVKLGHNYKSWLTFAIDIDHANHITKALVARGINAKALHSDTNKDRDKLIKEFKAGEIRALVSVGMVTTGFDAPNTDLIALLRPTKSVVLHVQMVGRGLRITPDKDHCLVLDFAGNTKRLGPINNVDVKEKKKKKSKGEAPVKVCPDCGCMHSTLAKTCDVCGHRFEFKQKLKTKADNVEIVVKEAKKWVDVMSVRYHIHNKPGRPPSLRVVYIYKMGSVSEFVCIEHGGYPQYLAENWIRQRWTSNDKIPVNATGLLKNKNSLKTPVKILLDKSQKYPSIDNVIFIDN